MARSATILWLNYPNNPTGAIAPLEFFERAVAFARRYDLLICHDNPYCDVAFDGYQAPSLLQVPGAMDVTLEFNSLSKTYNMAGWRVGMAVGNAAAVDALAKTKTNIDSGIFRPIQDASVLVLTGDQAWLDERNAIYRERRDIILAALHDMGIQANKPVASLYIWARTPAGLDLRAVCRPAPGQSRRQRHARHGLWRPGRRLCAHLGGHGHRPHSRGDAALETARTLGWEVGISRDSFTMGTVPERALLVGAQIKSKRGGWQIEDSLAELGQLAQTAGLEVAGQTWQRLDRFDPATLIGSGKVEELLELRDDLGFGLVIFDEELSPRQLRNLEKTLG